MLLPFWVGFVGGDTVSRGGWQWSTNLKEQVVAKVFFLDGLPSEFLLVLLHLALLQELLLLRHAP